MSDNKYMLHKVLKRLAWSVSDPKTACPETNKS